jgi:CRISPR/Cas system-associated exonuclease Cas4 (RecB family)
VSFFDDWGSKKNPVRQSDLVTLFGSMFGCAKKFAMSKFYPRDVNKVGYKGIMGELMHDAIGNTLQFGKCQTLEVTLDQHPKRSIVDFDGRTVKAVCEEYTVMLDAILGSKEFASVVKRKVEVERAFMVQLGKFWVAGTVDCIIKGRKKGELVVLDWKTGQLISQYEMDNGYQANIYCHAVEHGTFFLKPDDMDSGRSYHTAFEKTMQKNTFGVYPQFYFAQLKELIPAKRKSKRKVAHYSAEKMGDEDGNIVYEKGDRKGPVFYEARTDPRNIKRLEHSVNAAILYAKSGIFPESFGAHCAKCSYNERCKSLGKDVDMKQGVISMMEELGIEPD